jgi:hypothetical protein
MITWFDQLFDCSPTCADDATRFSNGSRPPTIPSTSSLRSSRGEARGQNASRARATSVAAANEASSCLVPRAWLLLMRPARAWLLLMGPPRAWLLLIRPARASCHGHG